MSLIDDLKIKYHTATVVEKLIAINIVAFVAFYLFNTMTYLFGVSGNFLNEWLTFPKEIGEYIFKPWTIITYAFLHSGIRHILFNMILLYFCGRLFLTFLTEKRLVTVYLLGAIFGALVYMLSYNLFPAFNSIGPSYLVGASASVMAILIATASYAPQMSVRLFIIGNVKLWWIAAFFVVVDIIQIPMGNAGGHLAHLGGALFGYIYSTQLKKGNDIGVSFEKFTEGTAQVFSKKKKTPLKTVHRSGHPPSSNISKPPRRNTPRTTVKHTSQQQIDEILDKISKSGYESLTKEEKDFLFKVGKE